MDKETWAFVELDDPEGAEQVEKPHSVLDMYMKMIKVYGMEYLCDHGRGDALLDLF